MGGGGEYGIEQHEGIEVRNVPQGHRQFLLLWLSSEPTVLRAWIPPFDPEDGN